MADLVDAASTFYPVHSRPAVSARCAVLAVSRQPAPAARGAAKPRVRESGLSYSNCGTHPPTPLGKRQSDEGTVPLPRTPPVRDNRSASAEETTPQDSRVETYPRRQARRGFRPIVRVRCKPLHEHTARNRPGCRCFVI